MNVIISNASQLPIYDQIAGQIKKQIISGSLAEGEALPSIRTLAKELQVSVITTKHAYQILEQEGFIDTVTGKGSFVAAQNRELLREKKMKVVEDHLAEAVKQAKLLGISQTEVKKMLKLLFEEDE